VVYSRDLDHVKAVQRTHAPDAAGKSSHEFDVADDYLENVRPRARPRGCPRVSPAFAVTWRGAGMGGVAMSSTGLQGVCVWPKLLGLVEVM
jgi:hypothetical protein